MILGLLTVGSLIWYLVTTRRTGDLQLIGTVDANEVIVSSKIPGRIQTLTVEEGQDVKAGQLIAVIESEDLEAARKAAEATAASAAFEAAADRGHGAAEPRRNLECSSERRSAGEVGAGCSGAGSGAISSISRPTPAALWRWRSRES